MKAARASLVRLADLSRGWKRDKKKKPDGRDSDACPGLSPDFSRFVLTGKAAAQFVHPAGAWLTSGTEIYASRQHAAGDFALGARPWLAKCLRYMLEHEDAKDGDPHVRIHVLSSGMVPSDPIGELTARFKLVARFIGPARKLMMYSDLRVPAGPQDRFPDGDVVLATD
jgi:hypothetical protein